jgi:hypothetical protein
VVVSERVLNGHVGRGPRDEMVAFLAGAKDGEFDDVVV